MFLKLNPSSGLYLILVLVLSILVPGNQQTSKLSLIFQWCQLEFDYTPAERQNAINNGTFIPGAPAPIDADVYYGYNYDEMFVTIPRFQEGIPATLAVVTDRYYNGNPILRPYPSWNWHRSPQSCKRDRIVSVFRVMVDSCERLWVLDAGRLGDNFTCPAQLLVFDLRTDTLIHRYEIPSSLVTADSILVTPIVDVRDTCADTFVYIADCQAFSIIVYDVRNGVSWRATDKSMRPDPKYGRYNISGDTFDLMDGVLGMSLSPYYYGYDRVLFYQPMSSDTQSWVYTSDLRDRWRFQNNPASSPEIFHTYPGRRYTQSAAEAADSNGVMFFGLMTNVTLNCWNTHTEYGPRNIAVVANDQKTLQFASGIKVIINHYGEEELLVLTSRFQKVAAGTMSTSEINFRIQIGSTRNLVAGTVCDYNY